MHRPLRERLRDGRWSEGSQTKQRGGVGEKYEGAKQDAATEISLAKLDGIVSWIQPVTKLQFSVQTLLSHKDTFLLQGELQQVSTSKSSSHPTIFGGSRWDSAITAVSHGCLLRRTAGCRQLELHLEQLETARRTGIMTIERKGSTLKKTKNGGTFCLSHDFVILSLTFPTQ
jgi:hypothetical protein